MLCSLLWLRSRSRPGFSSLTNFPFCVAISLRCSRTLCVINPRNDSAKAPQIAHYNQTMMTIQTCKKDVVIQSLTQPRFINGSSSQFRVNFESSTMNSFFIRHENRLRVGFRFFEAWGTLDIIFGRRAEMTLKEVEECWETPIADVVWPFLKLATKILFLLSFRILFRTLNHQYDYTFDWTMLKQRSMQQPGVMAITHTGAATGNDETDRRNKEKQPSETELK